MSKKAFTMQFHWIFVLVAGAIILAFFFSLVQKQRVLSQDRLSITLATDIEAVFSGAIESKGTAQPLPVPKTGIAFSCSQACECNFYIGKKATSFRDKIIFAPDLVTGQDAVAWAQEFKMPFRITNFLYFTNPNVKYYLVYRPSGTSLQMYKKINKTLPPGLNIDTLDSLNRLSRVRYEGFQETKFVFLDMGVNAPDIASALGNLNKKFRKEAVSAVSVSPSAIHFFEKKKNELVFTEYPTLFVDDPSVFAAMFSADKTMYECGMKAMFSRMSHVAQIVFERAGIIQNNMAQVNRTECVYLLNDLETIRNTAKDLSASLRLSDEIGLINTIVGKKEALERENRNIIQLSCPEIY